MKNINYNIDELIDDIEYEAEFEIEFNRLKEQVEKYHKEHGVINANDIEPVVFSEQFCKDSREETVKFLYDKYGKAVCDKLFGGTCS